MKSLVELVLERQWQEMEDRPLASFFAVKRQGNSWRLPRVTLTCLVCGKPFEAAKREGRKQECPPCQIKRNSRDNLARLKARRAARKASGVMP